jgi:putative ABC transport system permease protein
VDTADRPARRAWSAREAETLAARLSAVPGVTAAVPDPAFYIQRVTGGRAGGDPEQSLIAGHAWSSAALGGYGLTAGRPPSRAGEVAVAAASPGERIEVLTAAGPATWAVTGTVGGPGFYVADDEAARMSAGVRVIGLTTDVADPSAVASAARVVLAGPADADAVLVGVDGGSARSC